MTKGLEKERTQNIILSIAKVLAILFVYLIVGGVFQLIGTLAAGIPFNQIVSFSDYTVNHNLVIFSFDLMAVLLVVYVFRQYIDKKSFFSLGFSMYKRFKDLLAGFFVAALLFSLGLFILLFTDNIGINWHGFEEIFLFRYFILLLIVALVEEILFRAYILSNLMGAINKYVALVISAILFSLLHGLNDHISFLSLVNLFLAGILLGISYIFTRNIWFPVSLHLFWNFLQGPVLGFNVSGHKTESLFTLIYSENNTINGGEFGFEGSVVCSILSIVFVIVIFVFIKQKHN
jgi:membrane protease YdiL (CAAX protease family)